MHKTIFTITALVFIVSTPSAAALAPGDSAPPLQVGEWVQQSPVDLLNPDPEAPKPYFLIEFWATWCQPCRTLMPHINKLQRQYAAAGFVVIGVSTEQPGVVRRFVESMGPGMSYAVVVDTDQRGTYDAYMRAVNAPGIPHAFLIDRDGKLVWHGVPAPQNIDDVIKRLAGTDYTLKSEQLAQRAERLVARYFATVKRGDNDEAAPIGKRIVEWGSGDPGLLRDFAWRILTEPGLDTRDAAIALEAATVAAEGLPGDFRALEALALAQYESGQTLNAVETQQRAIEACPDEILRKRMGESLDKFGAELAGTSN